MPRKRVEHLQNTRTFLRCYRYANYFVLYYVFLIAFQFCIFYIRCLDSSVGIATGYGLDDRGVGVRVPVG
jgi:hypothetical protein